MQRKWPGDARCVVSFTVDFDGTGNEVGRRQDPVGIHSAGAYSARQGVPRMIRIFEHHQIPSTFFIPGYDAEHNPDIVREALAAGHEIAAHGYVHESWDISEDEEEKLLRKSHDILSDLMGKPPIGWRSPGGQKSTRTLAVLRDLGYIYDSSDKDYDRPYPAIVAGERSSEMVELPNNTSSLDDAPLYVGAAMTPMEMLELWKAEFDFIYNNTGYFLLTYHPRSGFGSGTPSRARVIDRLLEYIKGFPGVHFANMEELARWCLQPENGFIETETWIGGRA